MYQNVQPASVSTAGEKSFNATRALGAGLFVYAAVFVYVGVRHLLYPGFAEPMEGDILQSAARAAYGQQVYAPPAAGYIPLTYLPFYYYAAAPFYRLFGDALIATRMVSVLCACASAGLVGWLAWRESGRNKNVGLIAMTLFFASYRLMDAYLFCGLPDSLLLFWILLGYCFLAYGTNRKHDLAWLACYALAFWTKQQGAFFFGCALLYALFLRPAPASGERRLPRPFLLLGMLLSAPLVYKILIQAWGGDFTFYTLIMPARWERSLWFGVRRSLYIAACFVPFALLLLLIYARPTGLKLTDLRAKLAIPSVWLALSSLMTATVTVSSAGSSNNHYIPFVAALCISSAVGAFRLVRAHTTPPRLAFLFGVTALICVGMTALSIRYFYDHDIPLFAPVVAVGVWLFYLACTHGKLETAARARLAAALLIIGQLGVAWYNPFTYTPARDYQTSLTRLRAELGALDGKVLWLTYGHAPDALQLPNVVSSPSWVALEDVARQQTPHPETDAELAPFYNRLQASPQLYLLTDTLLDEEEPWRARLVRDYELARDYGTAFQGFGQIDIHWYSGRSFPRYLYRRNHH